MPSKGVHVFTYISVPGISIEITAPRERIVRSYEGPPHRFRNGTFEVDARNIDSFFDKRGRLTFKVLWNNTKLITEQWIDVNAITGNASGGTMDTIASTPAVFSDEANGLIVAYGFYEAGPGHDVLPNRHQCYITVAPNYNAWMSRLVPPGSDKESKPFHRFVLPSAHDVGMNSMQSSEAILEKIGGAIVSTLVNDNRVMSEITDAVSGPAIALIAPNIIFSLAITQKDTLNTMLAIGARYFEFRPAHCHKAVLPALGDALPDKLYFQHSAIPGMGYDAFLKDVVAFLSKNKSEIVVVQLRWDGVPPECARPTDQEKRDYLNEALRQANGEIVAGNVNDLRNATIGQLRREKKRLIVTKMIDSLSTYTDEGNATLNGDSIVAAFPKILTPENRKGKAFINIQCQATATNVPRAVVLSVLEAGTTTSCILATKAICDSKTLPWCRDNVLKTCGNDHLVVLMNDFIDGGTADVAVHLSKQRLEK